MHRRLGLVLACIIAVGAFVLLPAPVAATPDVTPATLYEWHAGDAFLAAFNPSLSPAIAVSGGGETIEVLAMGTLQPALKAADGSGTYVWLDASGTVVASGTLQVLELVNFRSFGSGGSQGYPEFFEGGSAMLRVHLQPASGGPGETATLRVDCALGKAPPGQTEGIRLSVMGGPNFNRSVQGGTLFIRIG